MPFSKGDKNINRVGRPRKGDTFADYMRVILDDPITGKSKRQIISEKMIEAAKDGDLSAQKFVIERVDGKAVETVVSKDMGKTMPKNIKVIFEGE